MWQSLMELCCRKGRTAIALQVCGSLSCIPSPSHKTADEYHRMGQRLGF